MIRYELTYMFQAVQIADQKLASYQLNNYFPLFYIFWIVCDISEAQNHFFERIYQ